MNKDQFLAISNKSRPLLSFLDSFCQKYDEFMTNEPQKPEAYNPRPVSLKSKRMNGTSKEDNTSITNTISICSNMSRIGMDKFVIQNILNNRKEHHIFSELEPTETEKSKIWYYVDEKDGNTVGPFTNAEMDQRFELMIFKESTKIKKKFDEDYYPLMTFIKRYFKNVLSEKIDLEKKDASKLSNKIIKFHKGEAIKAPVKIKEKFDPKQREERFFSHAIRPKLVDLNNMLPKDDEEEGTDCYSRMRANTLNQK